MTLQPYGPKKLDQFALRLLDVAGVVREMAHSCREHGVDDLALHDKKASQWCDNLEQWAERARSELDVRIRQARSKRRTSTADQ